MITEIVAPPVNGPTPGGAANHKRWSRDEEQFLLECTRMGFNAKEIAPLLERTEYSIWGKRSELGISWNRDRVVIEKPEPPKPNYFVRDIQQIVADYYRISVDYMTAPSGPGKNARVVSHPRQVAMYLATEMTDHTLVRIGSFFGGRDHTTVRHARLKIGAMISKLGPTRKAVAELTELIQLKNAEEYGLVRQAA